MIYVQCDGGSENANMFVLATCELAVVKGFAETVVFTRLPTGHGYNDDGAFGMMMGHLPTYESLKTLLEKVFKGSKLNIKVVDLHTINDWKWYFKDCIDKSFKKSA